MSSTSIGCRYPPARRSEAIDVYKSEARGEVEVPDPYQWLEATTEETHNWTTAQEALMKEYLERNLNRQLLEDDIRSNTDYAKVLSLDPPPTCDVLCGRRFLFPATTR
jgi:prolyl oligopeptidase